MIPNYPDNERVAVFAGTFSPFTTGHMSILKRSLAIFDRVLVAVGFNSNKGETADSREATVEQIRRVTSGLDGVDVTAWDGLTVDLANKCGARFLVRGVRSVADFEYERNLADINREISGIETVILFALPELAMVSSSMVRELQSYGYDTSRFLPQSQK